MSIGHNILCYFKLKVKGLRGHSLHGPLAHVGAALVGSNTHWKHTALCGEYTDTALTLFIQGPDSS